MPILFDPGAKVLEECRKLDFQIRTVPGPTSWGTACALSGWEPPFEVYGFLPKEKIEREATLKSFANAASHTVLMEVPYRFESLLKEISMSLGTSTPGFLAWEIGTDQEKFFWGSIGEITESARQLSLVKGEFVFILQSRKRRERPKK